jgi:hypothetical protein
MLRKKWFSKEGFKLYVVGDSCDEEHWIAADFLEPCMACAACNAGIAGESDVLEEVLEHARDAVFSYDLEVLGKTIKCFSATNPNDNRFDVVRFGQEIDFIKSDSSFFSDHSWFPGYLWAPAGCETCGDFLGWKFRHIEQDDNEFFGLIITKLRYRPTAGMFARHVFTFDPSEDPPLKLEIHDEEDEEEKENEQDSS